MRLGRVFLDRSFLDRSFLRQLSLVSLCALAGVDAAHAQTGPVIVVPGKPGVPVLINGVIVDGAVVYGDWGLARGAQGQIIIEGPVMLPEYYPAPGYFPKTGRKPRVGRLEIEPPPRPRGSTSYHRTWSAGSDMTRPVTEYPPYDPPPVIVAPRGRLR
jgi:hypothetical protein